MKIITIIGARPQFIKAAVGSKSIGKYFNEIIIHTGQHFDINMSRVFFDELGIPTPKYNLGISGGTHCNMTSRMMDGIEPILLDEKPGGVLVYGDTNSTLAAAITAVKLHIPVFHVEAGNRLGTLDNPEEVNRICTDHVATLNFAATQSSLNNLIYENIGDNSFFTGNIMLDAYFYYSKFKPNFNSFLNFNDEIISIPNEYNYLTCHREENTYTDEPLKEILCALNELDCKTIFPVHPRNKSRAYNLLKKYKFEKIILINPVGYIESLYLLNNAKLIITDSGGLQTEAFFAKKQCLFIFKHVVWPETMVGFRNQLVTANRDDILEKMNNKQEIDDDYKPFGDGHAADLIADYIYKFYN